MREIKFRGWHVAKKRMFSAEEMATDQLTLLTTGSFINVSGSHTSMSKIFDRNKFIPLQYIGLKDKNGKEIYEGDLVNIRNWGRTDEVLHKATIVWDQQTASWQFDPWFDVDEYDRWRKIEVIGNIYEPRP